MRRETAPRVSRRNFLLGAGTTGVAALSGCIQRRSEYDGGDGETGGPVTGEIAVAGSSTVFPLTRTMRVEFQKEYPEVDISVSSTGTGGGFGNFFCTGDRALNNASRPIKDSEVEQCGENGIEPVELRVATDAMTVVVNNDADWVDCVTVDELAQIWGPDGADRWSDVREDWPDEPFELYGPASTSGTFDYFTESIIGEEDAHREDYQPTEDDNTIVTGVSGDDHGMGYFGFAHYQGNSDAVKALEIEDPETENGCVAPTLENAAAGDYTPLSRPLFLYVSRDALQRPAVREFCRFYVRNATSRALVSDAVGYVPLTEEQRSIQRGRLEHAIDIANGRATE
ncbi:PstS family phosphate ABC transporter substrate-binding protein [Haloarcula laminariae]|uniref:PstS family phosphate ABC transporter substrate-binding protein n=1 Tax=Haloarcula laminariae TaxID=2961577 RepID=UPI0021C66D19|nr:MULTISPECIES: PstS family phosphate ABC transporter substrate-binding protein [Halomicroarcula]